MAIYHLQKSYRAAYHPIKDADEWPIANLIILLSQKGYPLRAELHMNTDAPTPNGSPSAEAYALAVARQIVEESYATNNAKATKLEVRPYHVDQRHPTEHIDLNYRPTEQEAEPLFGPWLIAAIAGILMILIGIIWGFSTLFNRSANGISDGITDGIVIADGASGTAISGGSETVVDASQVQSGSGAASQASAGNGGNQLSAGDQGAGQALPTVDPTLAQTNGLAPSTNANNDLQVGQRVRVIPGSALTLRSAPGADGGEAIGFMENAQEATIIGGPYWLQGVSDTIVWWYIRLDGGTEAWAPANDSNFTLLEVAPRG